MQVLGVEADADNNTINRAYRLKRFEARGNEELTAQIEAAHSQLMFSSLSARLKVGRSEPRGRAAPGSTAPGSANPRSKGRHAKSLLPH